jgi:hypothetical protein
MYPAFLNYVETRKGFILNDPLLNVLPAADLTWIIFGLIYSSLAAALIYFFQKPHSLVKILQAYSLLIVIRIIAMNFAAFEPPIDMIPLTDPFVEFFGTGNLLTKDLFFSGHTATIFLFYLFTENKYLKIFFFISTLAVAVAVLLQHVHYTIDVITAPFFSYLVFVIINYLQNKKGYKKDLKERLS